MSNEDRIPPIIPPRNDLDCYESELTRQLADLHREYMARAQPLLDALAYCRSLRPAPPIIVRMPGKSHLPDFLRAQAVALSVRPSPPPAIDFIIIDDPLAKQEEPKC
jgi:hypothetical protein